uniref:Uncharacterized protein n=1 Tax=viral metagenome TaxID=1070528 RepID=A0A6M3KW68_9ZZZZ
MNGPVCWKRRSYYQPWTTLDTFLVVVSLVTWLAVVPVVCSWIDIAASSTPTKARYGRD